MAYKHCANPDLLPGDLCRRVATLSRVFPSADGEKKVPLCRRCYMRFRQNGHGKRNRPWDAMKAEKRAKRGW